MAENALLLEAATDAYLRSLSGLKYPQALVEKFPRIANAIVALKNDKRRLREYFESLTNDTRGGRQGFPFDILMDIHNIREAMLGDNTGFVLDDNTKWVS
jgi:hypothetical protein